MIYGYKRIYHEVEMLALRLPPGIEKRLDQMAKKTGRTKTFYACQAIKVHIDDLEDGYLALDRLNDSNAKFVSHAEAKKRLGL